MFVLVSCSARRSITPAYGPFRLKSVNGDSVLLTPPIPEGQHEYASIKLTLTSSPSPPGLHCSAERGPFRIEQEKNGRNSVDITIPSPATWLSDLEGRLGSPGENGIETLFAILADLDKLRETGCFANTKLSIRDSILQSLPMKPTDSLFNYYGYLADRSWPDLTPGMRLKIERAYFQPAEVGEEEHSAKLFLGLSTAYFNLQLASNGKIRFHQKGTARYTPASLTHRLQDGTSDLGVSSIPPERHFRLLFNTYFVPEKHTRSTAIIGATYAPFSLKRSLRAGQRSGVAGWIVSFCMCAINPHRRPSTLANGSERVDRCSQPNLNSLRRLSCPRGELPLRIECATRHRCAQREGCEMSTRSVIARVTGPEGAFKGVYEQAQAALAGSFRQWEDQRN